MTTQEYAKAYYQANKEKWVGYNRKAYEPNRDRIWALKSAPCTDCGKTFHPAAMDFDHLGDKVAEIGKMMGMNWSKIEAELAKCELVCSNCHRIRTYHRKGNA